MRATKKRLRAILIAIMYFALYYAVSILLDIVYYLSQSSKGASLSEIKDALTNGAFPLGVIASVISVWIYLLIGKIRKKPFKSVIHNEKKAPMIILMAICLAFGARLCVSAYYHFSQSFEILKKSIDDAAALTPTLTGVKDLLVALFASIIVAPVFEEILFRGLIFTELKTVMKTWAANVLQALLFGVAHAVLFQSLFAFVMGILFGTVYDRTRSISACAICHGAFNLSVVITGSNLTKASAVLVFVCGVLLVSSSLMYIVFSDKRTK